MDQQAKGSVGIMTFHWAANYGAVLQAWALQHFLEQHHYHVELIDYVPKTHRITLLRCFMTRHPDKMYSRLVEYRREQKMKSFRKEHMHLSKRKYSHQEELIHHPPEYEFYVSGSDQIWNPTFTMDGRAGVNLSYFLRFAPVGKKKIAVASSFGAKKLPTAMEAIIKEQLKSFAAVSVREEEAKAILERLDVNTTCILDPTLLFNADVYQALLPGNAATHKTIFQYMLHNQDCFGDFVSDKLSVAKGLLVDKSKYVSVEEWLQKIRNASIVVTNSFHCVVFSILFHKPFIAIDVEGAEMSSRITTLLSKVGLSERFLKQPVSEDAFMNLPEINWVIVDEKVQKHREQTQHFILQALTSSETIEQIPESKCTGCGLCAQICPKSSIKMEENQRGFVFPRVDKSTCINCGLCVAKCIVNQKQPSGSQNQTTVQAFACWHNDSRIRLSSSSGGAFSALAETVFQQGGTVFGASFVDSMRLAHVKTENMKELASLRGSKYMASDISACFQEIRTQLDCNKKVLFCGTPCQIAAIRQFIGERDNLFCIDIACHGIPSGKVLREYCKDINKNSGKLVDHIDFRNKKYGWVRFSCTYFDKDHQEIISEVVDESNYMSGYIDNLFLRDSCETCRFARIPRVGDLTLADCWYMVHKKLDQDDKGITAVLVNTAKGKALFDAACDKMNVLEVSIDDVIGGTPTLVRPSGSNKNKPLFWQCFEKKGLLAAFRTVYFSKNMKSAVKRGIRGLKS